MNERDPDRPTTEQGLFRKYDVQRVDGKDDGLEPYYLVLRIDNLAEGKLETAALRAYVDAAQAVYPALAKDLRKYLPKADNNSGAR